MELDRSIRKADARILAVMAAVLVGLVGVIAYSAKEPAASTARVAPIPVTHRSMLSTASQVAPGIVDTKPAAAPEERWDADESPQGTRSDATH